MRYRLGMLLVLPLCVVAAVIGLVWMLASIAAGSARAWRLAIGFDQLANVALGGDEDCTISARCWACRAEQPYKTLRWMIDGAFGAAGFDRHCETAWEVELAKAAARVQRSVTGSQQ